MILLTTPSRITSSCASRGETSRTDARNVTTTITHNGLDQVTGKTSSDGRVCDAEVVKNR